MRGFKIARIFGIDIIIDWSLLFLFALVAWGLSDYLQNWPAAILAALLFIFSILFHEMAHSLIAKRFGISVRKITLLIFGGAAQLESGPGFGSPKKEFFISIVGPLSSLVLAAIFFGLLAYFSTLGAAAWISLLLSWLGTINVILAVFNILPAFPMDGGRILRSLCWWKTGSLIKATKIARNTTFVFAILLPVGGFFWDGLFSTFWLALIAGFILVPAAIAEYDHVLRGS